MQIRTEEVYEALFDDDAFNRLPDFLARAGNARSALLLWEHFDGLSQAMAFNHYPQTMMQTYNTHWAAADPWVIGGLRSGRPNEMVLLEHYVPAVIYEKTPFYNEFIRKSGFDTFHCSGGIIRSAWGQGVIGVQRERRDKAFEHEDAKRLNEAAIHVERVLRARGEMSSAQRAAAFAQGALDAIGLVAITVGANGRILHSNVAAEAVLRRADAIVSKSGHVSGVTAEAANSLAKAITAATAPCNPAATSLVADRGPDEPAYLITVTPLAGRVGQSAALILFRDPAIADRSLTNRLRTLFNLTNAEAIVTIDVANGLALPAIARNRGVRISTLRAQLKSVAVKTGCSRQAELVALVGRVSPLV